MATPVADRARRPSSTEVRKNVQRNLTRLRSSQKKMPWRLTTGRLTRAPRLMAPRASDEHLVVFDVLAAAAAGAGLEAAELAVDVDARLQAADHRHHAGERAQGP